MLVLSAIGLVLAGVSYWLLREHPFSGLLAGLVAFVEALVAGLVLGGKRGVVMALAEGLRTLRLGRSLVRLLFERMLGVQEGKPVGERGGRLAQTLETMPLATAEKRLGVAVTEGMRASEQEGSGSWVRRKILARLLRWIEKYTLGRFREENARHGGIDLLKLQADLEKRIDDLLIHTVRRNLTRITITVVVLLPVVVIIQVYCVWALVK
jgi:hypothetical protein